MTSLLRAGETPAPTWRSACRSLRSSSLSHYSICLPQWSQWTSAGLDILTPVRNRGLSLGLALLALLTGAGVLVMELPMPRTRWSMGRCCVHGDHDGGLHLSAVPQAVVNAAQLVIGEFKVRFRAEFAHGAALAGVSGP